MQIPDIMSMKSCQCLKYIVRSKDSFLPISRFLGRNPKEMGRQIRERERERNSHLSPWRGGNLFPFWGIGHGQFISGIPCGSFGGIFRHNAPEKKFYSTEIPQEMRKDMDLAAKSIRAKTTAE